MSRPGNPKKKTENETEIDCNNPPNGEILKKQFDDLQRKGLWGGKKTKKNKNRKTKRYISKLNKRNKTRKRRNKH